MPDPTDAKEPQTGRSFDGHHDEVLPCGCVVFYHGGIVPCAEHVTGGTPAPFTIGSPPAVGMPLRERPPILNVAEWLQENSEQVAQDEARFRRLHEQYANASVDDLVYDLHIMVQMLLHKRHMETLRAVPHKG
jgi:hypothetical protein